MARDADIRNDILTYLYGARPIFRTVENIERANARNGEVRDAKEIELERELAYLAGKGLVNERRRELDQGTKEFAISPNGVDFMEREGLV